MSARAGECPSIESAYGLGKKWSSAGVVRMTLPTRESRRAYGFGSGLSSGTVILGIGGVFDIARSGGVSADGVGEGDVRAEGIGGRNAMAGSGIGKGREDAVVDMVGGGSFGTSVC